MNKKYLLFDVITHIWDLKDQHQSYVTRDEFYEIVHHKKRLFEMYTQDMAIELLNELNDKIWDFSYKNRVMTHELDIMLRNHLQEINYEC